VKKPAIVNIVQTENLHSDLSQSRLSLVDFTIKVVVIGLHGAGERMSCRYSVSNEI
jgi:hypothetical protein